MELQDTAVVITGASSGIGRATALEFARGGARLVLAARRQDVIEEVAEECRRLGVRALAVQTDVTNQDEMTRLAERAVETYGRIDVWVNNAGVTMFGGFESAPLDSFRRVIETNLWGTIHGARAALPVFRRQGSGVLIDVASMVADVSRPYASADEISKHGIRALDSSLRQELLLEGQRGISVCTVLPAVIDTPLFQHAANYTGRAVRAMPPVVPAEKVAEAIVRLAQKPDRETFVGAPAWLMRLQRALAPGPTERQLARMVDKRHFDSDTPVGPSDGNLFTPTDDGKGISGGWMGQSDGTIAKVAAGAAAVAGLAILARRLTVRSEPPPPRNALESATRALSSVASKVPTLHSASMLGAISITLPTRQLAEILAGVAEVLPTRQSSRQLGKLADMLPTKQVMDAVSGLPSKVPTKRAMGTLDSLPGTLSARLPVGKLPLVSARRG